MFCEYGCGQEAKYRLRNGKWCCSRSWNSCPTSRKKNSFGNKGKVISEEMKVKLSLANTGKKRSKVTRNRISMTHKGRKLTDELRKKLSKIHKERCKDEEIRKSLSHKRTIEWLQRDHPKFCTEEEMRYNPQKHEEVQVRCKNSRCINSKEKNGWFTPTDRQLELRIYALEHRNNGNQYFFCSEKCKQESVFYSIHPKKDLNFRTAFDNYKGEVVRLTNRTVRLCPEKICRIELRSPEFHLDHKFSVYRGFEEGIDPKVISHWKNLEVLPKNENLSKKCNCSITLDELCRGISYG